jgi:PPOX class probable F420-dependent enzyme
MDVSRAVDFVRRHHHAVLTTMRRDGTPQMSPVLVAVDDAGRVVVSSRETAMKTKNVRRDPRAWVCVFTDSFFGSWHQLAGDVEVLSLPDAMEPLVEYYRSAVGEHPDWDDYRAAMEREQRCLLRITVTHAGPDASG